MVRDLVRDVHRRRAADEPSPAGLEFISGHQLAHSSYCSGMETHVADLAAAAPLSFDFDRRTRGYAAHFPHPEHRAGNGPRF